MSKDDTEGTYSVVDARMFPKGGPFPHIQTLEHERFYVLKGEIVYKNPDSDSIPEFVPYEKTRHVPCEVLCAPGFMPLGEICVFDDRCGSGAYPESMHNGW